MTRGECTVTNSRLVLRISPEIKNTKKSIWEEKCMICKENLFKYRCPRCEVLTCSLSCVNKHKKESKCSGKRDKTQYIPLSQFTEGDLISDLQFLRDAKQATDRFRKRRGMVHE